MAAASPAVPTDPNSVVPTAPIPGGLSNFLTLVLFSIKTFVIVPISFLHFLARGLYYALNFLSGPAPAEVALTSQFKIGSSSATVPNPVSKTAAFFAHFEQVKTNDLNPAELWSA